MNDDRRKALDALADERAKEMKPAPPPLTLESFHQRLTALEAKLFALHGDGLHITNIQRPNGYEGQEQSNG